MNTVVKIRIAKAIFSLHRFALLHLKLFIRISNICDESLSRK